MAKYLIFILLSGCASTSDIRVIANQIDFLNAQVERFRDRQSRDEDKIETLEQNLCKRERR